MTQNDCCIYQCLVHLHGFLEPAIGTVDAAAEAMNHLFCQADIIALWSVRDRGATLRMGIQRRRGTAIQTQHEDAAFDRIQILLVCLV